MDVTRPINNGATPMYIACEKCLFEIVQWLHAEKTGKKGNHGITGISKKKRFKKYQQQQNKIIQYINKYIFLYMYMYTWATKMENFQKNKVSISYGEIW